MNVFVESNFMLELALRQGESREAIGILELAEQGAIRLIVPAFSLVEPRYKLYRDRSERLLLRDSLDRHLEQMVRSEGFADLRERSNVLRLALASKADADTAEFEAVIQRIMKCGVVLPLTQDVLAAALIRQTKDLEPLDALVFASVEGYLKSNPGDSSVFANKDAKGFLSKSVADDLDKHGCVVIPTFNDTLAFIQKRIKPSEGPQSK
jgi:predicted nucleic acid-binding protein